MLCGVEDGRQICEEAIRRPNAGDRATTPLSTRDTRTRPLSPPIARIRAGITAHYAPLFEARRGY